MDSTLRYSVVCTVCFLGVWGVSEASMRSCVTYTNSQLPEPTLSGWRLTQHVFLRLEVSPVGGDYWSVINFFFFKVFGGHMSLLGPLVPLTSTDKV